MIPPDLLTQLDEPAGQPIQAAPQAIQIKVQPVQTSGMAIQIDALPTELHVIHGMPDHPRHPYQTYQVPPEDGGKA